MYAEILCDLVEAQKNIYEAADLAVNELATASRTDKLKYQDLVAALQDGAAVLETDPNRNEKD